MMMLMMLEKIWQSRFGTPTGKTCWKDSVLVVEILSRWVETGKNNRFFSGSGLNWFSMMFPTRIWRPVKEPSGCSILALIPGAFHKPFEAGWRLSWDHLSMEDPKLSSKLLDIFTTETSGGGTFVASRARCARLPTEKSPSSETSGA